MPLDVVVDMLKRPGIISSAKDTGFADALTTAKEICEEINVETVLKGKRVRGKNCHFSYECADDPVSGAFKRMETTFFIVVADIVTSSLNERLKIMGEVNEKFKVLLKFKN